MPNQVETIQVRQLFHQYAGTTKLAVEDMSFSIAKGEIFGFLGPSGSGKSTVQNIMIKLLSLQRGEVLYDGQSINLLKRNFFNQVGVSFEQPNLYLKLTGLENLKFHAGLYSGATENPEELMEAVGLEDAKHKLAGAYSKGMKQRLVFARSIINKPKLLFLDEPTSGLDPSTAHRIMDIIKEQQSRGVTIFLTTHNMQVADTLCSRIAFINDGKLVVMDSPRNLKLQYGERSLKVEYREAEKLTSELLFLEKAEDKARLSELVNSAQVETVHSQEATLEEIFIRLTGRGLI